MQEPEAPATLADAPLAKPQIAPTLLRDRSFWGMTLTQFLGAFNDNVYKQTLLLLFVRVPLEAGSTAATVDLQGIASLLFAVPFLLFSGFAGYLSDRYPKPRVIFGCKVAEVAIMAIGLLLFVVFDRNQRGMSLEMAAMFSIVLFLMGSHSAFFGPGKYGILPELFRDRDLPQANGMILMTTFLAIIFGTVLAGQLMDAFPNQLAVIGATCVGIAVLGVATSLMVRRLPASHPGLPFSVSYLAVPREMRSLLKHDPQLHLALWMSSVFWMAGAMVLLAVNALGDIQFGVAKSWTSLLWAAVSGGIAAGSLMGGLLSRGRFHTGVLKIGAWGLFASLVILALPGGPTGQLLGYWGSFACLIAVGVFTGMFAVPLQVLMQMRPPADLKGQMIATMNLLNWGGIVLGGAAYQVLSLELTTRGWPPSTAFAVIAAMFGAVALFYHPQSETPAAE
jgi:acyl-[acyl-carrier-protein]-phospholipid O-acyltransferase/long-chain-fatty-acid--[acyl-carrier-protein] ligase